MVATAVDDRVVIRGNTGDAERLERTVGDGRAKESSSDCMHFTKYVIAMAMHSRLSCKPKDI